MLKRLLLSSLAVAVLTLATPGYAIDPNADVTYHPVSVATSETILTNQIQATTVAAQGAYGDPNLAPPTSSLFADSHTIMLADIYAGGNINFFSLEKYDPTRTVNGNPVGTLQGVLLYFTVALKNGRQVLDNESANPIGAAIVDIGVDVDVHCYEPSLIQNPKIKDEISFSTKPRITVAGSLAADTDGPDWGPPNPWFPDVNNLTDAEIDGYSTGADRLAAIIDPSDPNNSTAKQPIYTITDPDILAAFTGDGDILFSYDSDPMTSHFVGDQDFVEWTVTPQFDIEARVVYLYTGVPEPATLGLLSAAFAPALLRRVRRKRRT